MKKIYLTLMMFMSLQILYAQDTTQLAGKMQFVFAQLNRNDISTGFMLTP